MTARITFLIFAFLSVMIGLYPLGYYFGDMSAGLLNTKSEVLKSSIWWQIGFNLHIYFGGISLLTGWSQFSKKLRKKNISLHRLLGKIYVLSVLVSGLAGFYIGWYATGGLITAIGFISLSIVWLSTTTLAYMHVRKGKIEEHRIMMIYSFAACFGAVTLRIWMPLLMAITGDFLTTYRIVAWLAWVPNLLVAYIIIKYKGYSYADPALS